ncbi:uncharacterized protein EAF01_002330 [Botrytis porri]|uniref:uncharacterized protein n=1 Tax=Botrytis porri TaxID=87229 RepID=UPI0019008DF5|nr:uncharacterized protein EAF01_002330 [Botrytis porri]KAF7910821.1 hypothetical protein EAF01_002330 [Botrytis porri]
MSHQTGRFGSLPFCCELHDGSSVYARFLVSQTTRLSRGIRNTILLNVVLKKTTMLQLADFTHTEHIISADVNVSRTLEHLMQLGIAQPPFTHVSISQWAQWHNLYENENENENISVDSILMSSFLPSPHVHMKYIAIFRYSQFASIINLDKVPIINPGSHLIIETMQCMRRSQIGEIFNHITLYDEPMRNE